mgnify:CR=1 FL=1
MDFVVCYHSLLAMWNITTSPINADTHHCYKTWMCNKWYHNIMAKTFLHMWSWSPFGKYIKLNVNHKYSYPLSLKKPKYKPNLEALGPCTILFLVLRNIITSPINCVYSSLIQNVDVQQMASKHIMAKTFLPHAVMTYLLGHIKLNAKHIFCNPWSGKNIHFFKIGIKNAYWRQGKIQDQTYVPSKN